MKPNDESGKLPTAERPFRVLIISGSNRRQYNCPGVDSKSRTLMLRMAERLPQAYGYEAPGHFIKDLKLKWREIKIGMGHPPEGSSPAKQEELDPNKDETLTPRKSEGEKLRES
jgi:hypothetical protein